MSDISYVPADAAAAGLPPTTPQLPSADDFRASLTQLPSAADFRSSLRAPGDEHDLLASAWRGFQSGASQPLEPETVQAMRDVGLLNDYSKGQKSIVRTFNEALLNSVALPLYHLGTGIYGAVRGMAEAEPDDLIGKGIKAGAQLATGGMEAFPVGHLTGLPAAAIEPTIGTAAISRAAAPVGRAVEAVRSILPEAQEAATESARRAAVEALSPTAGPTNQPRQGEVTIESIEAKPLGTFAPAEGAAATAAAEAEAVPEASPPDLHIAAGQIAPDLFREYDAIEEQRNALRSTIGDLADMRDRGTSPAIDEIDQQIDALRGQRLELPAAERPAMADQITTLEDQRAKLADALPETGDTPEMATLRQQMLDLDIRRRDMLPQVRDAYRQAAEGATEPPAETPVTETPAETAPAAPPVAEAPPTEATAPATEQAAPAPPQAPVEGGIAGDVSKQLVAAGRPQEEADAAGALVQAHYEARAARFGGELGTADDLYRNEAPAVRAGRRQRAAELVQRRKGYINFTDDAKATVTLLKDADASTFIHETGHAWLDEMLRDAADERAPQDLRDDAATVRKWLGVPEDATLRETDENGRLLYRKQHETFARSFERYMMEGHAPSKALASVFAKFKQWLTQIYQTVTRLRAPINDDIRAVFDRMLATPEREPIIAPGEPTRTFADLHEADAATTEPPQAAPIAEIVRSERDRVGEAAAPEVENERLTSRASPGENGGSAEGSGLSGPQEPAPRPPAGSPGGVSEPGPVGESRGNVASEGNRALEGQERNPVAADGRPVERPDQQLPVPDERLVDKAGNIRLDNIDTDEDVKDAIREAAARNGDFEGRRRGVVSDEQREALANALGTTPDKVLAKEIGTAFSDSEIKMLEKLFAQSSATVRDLAIRFAQTQSEADDMALATAIARHDMLQGLYSQATAEAGRAFRALRRSQEYWARGVQATAAELKNVLDKETGRTFDQRLALARKLVELDQPMKIGRAIRDAQKKGLFDWVEAAFRNWLLSGPFTHLGYTAAGEMFGLFRATAETAGTALVARVREAGLLGEARRALGEADQSRLCEMRAQVYGMLRGNRRGLKAAWQAIKENQAVFPKEAEPFIYGAQGGPVSAGGTIPNPKIGGRTVHIGNTIEFPSRVVGALHSFNWTTFYEQSMSSQAFRQAVSEGIDPASPAFNIRVSYLLEHPTDPMIEQGIKDAGSGALMQRPDYNSFMGRVSRVTNYGKTFPDLKIPGVGTLPLGTLRPVKFIDPFVQIQSNIQKSAFMRGTPLALFSSEVRADLSGRNGGAAFDRTAGRILAGTAFAAGGAALYFEGLMNNSGPSDPAEKHLWERTHGMPHGLNVGGMSFDMLRLGVLGLQWSVAADLAHAMGQIGDEDATKIASELVQGFAQNILDEGFARGPAELMQAVDDPDRYGASYVRNFASSFMPFSVGMGQIARQVDPNTHRARSLMDAFIAKTPVLSEELPPVYDIWGQPTPNRGWLGTYYERLKDDPVDKRLEQLGAKPSMPQRKINGIELTDQQYADYSRMAGQMARQRVEQFFNMSGSAQMPPQAQLDTVKKLVEASRRQAAGAIEVQSRGTPDDIIAKRQEVARAALHGATPDELKKMRAAH